MKDPCDYTKEDFENIIDSYDEIETSMISNPPKDSEMARLAIRMVTKNGVFRKGIILNRGCGMKTILISLKRWIEDWEKLIEKEGINLAIGQYLVIGDEVRVPTATDNCVSMGPVNAP